MMIQRDAAGIAVTAIREVAVSANMAGLYVSHLPHERIDIWRKFLLQQLIVYYKMLLELLL
jgi:hypothetical protein